VVYRTTVGRFEIASLQVWPLQQMPASEVLSGVDAASLEDSRARLPQFFGDDANLIELTQNICVIRSPDQVVLVDTGEPLRRAGAILEWGLASIGIAPHEIDLVFLTHRDSDHVGGTVNLHGEPQYGNAKYLISRFEYEEFKAEAKRAEQFWASIKPLEDRGLLEFFEDGAEIVPGLTAVPTPGHRSGASSLTHCTCQFKSRTRNARVSGIAMRNSPLAPAAKLSSKLNLRDCCSQCRTRRLEGWDTCGSRMGGGSGRHCITELKPSLEIILRSSASQARSVHDS
jgi:glyoxylase-like metal-dependent hydrolase (beta-lactamase superfamily II)